MINGDETSTKGGMNNCKISKVKNFNKKTTTLCHSSEVCWFEGGGKTNTASSGGGGGC